VHRERTSGRGTAEASPSHPGWGDLLPSLRSSPPGPASRRLAERLGQVESQNVTHVRPDFPVFWSRAKGANVQDADGNVLLDLTSAFGVSVAGHSHPKIVEAIGAQASKLVHGMGDVHPPEVKVRLLERLCAIAPWPEARGVLASAGSEAVEIALKTAHLATGRAGVVAFEGGYHGLTLGALSTTARNDFRDPFHERIPGGVTFVPFPNPRGAPEEESARCLTALDRALVPTEGVGDPPGAVIVEPIQGRGGVRIPPPGFLSEVSVRARQTGALLILDEIFTGLGRTGSIFAFEAEQIVPDLICLGKALGGGLPLSCCIGSATVMDAWPRSRGEALHTSTFLGHPLGCAASLALLDILEEEDLVTRAREEGDRLRESLAAALSGLAPGVQVRGRGMFVGIELEEEPGDRGGGLGFGARMASDLLRGGLIVLPAGANGEVVEITPPLTTARTQIDWSVETIARRTRALAASSGSSGPG
jgi:4-aminobutyrate aminotransferase-like enzyme